MSPARACPHLAELPGEEPAELSVGCEHCRDLGQRPVALRKCLECGHIGCCDSTPGRWARHHHAQTGHPVMRSFEPGEGWRWCFEDQRLV
ncbi:UBP-type zinc finger domain-containing protein [Streptacidiphilus fuscans]|uniref:UBP-type zinc finger domain-containing protein n=1 Tax=Streptacidiphilus fuscans TaxID=2789292 RepID=A0A931AZ86_9ACTN|nr:UBP-type zinc finger domain-containing protein [Streptacidiphilus fuscans]MBF9067554.1 UBP-type zinc finger domain-containing protein [Streptacidiphilus fuscans]